MKAKQYRSKRLLYIYNSNNPDHPNSPNVVYIDVNQVGDLLKELTCELEGKKATVTSLSLSFSISLSLCICIRLSQFVFFPYHYYLNIIYISCVFFNF